MLAGRGGAQINYSAAAGSQCDLTALSAASGLEQSEAGFRRLGRFPVTAPACADVLDPCLVKRTVSGLTACREVFRAQIRARTAAGHLPRSSYVSLSTTAW